MAKIRLTKNELKKQKDDLKRFTRYLPTLELKKKQLLVEISKIQQEAQNLQAEREKMSRNVEAWAGLFAEAVGLEDLVSIKEVRLEKGNVAGIDIPLFSEVIFDIKEYDFLLIPLWVDRALETVIEQLKRLVQIEVLRMQERVLDGELRITVQRIKLFEEVKIPESRENIRKIRIFLGDQQTAEVVRGKIAKKKIMRKKEMVTAS